MRAVAVTISAAGYDMTAQIIAEWAAQRFRGSRSVDVSSAYVTDIVYDRRA